MRQRYFAILSAIFIAFAAASPAARAASSERIVFAGGCFWGVQAVFNAVKGVTHTEAGFSGGEASTAHYEMVSTGTTGHAESVEIDYNPSQISFKQLLDIYFLVAHDPTTLNSQGPDQGTQYRSEIFYTSDAQRVAAQNYIHSLEQHHVFSAPIVTMLAPLQGFYAAEGYHQEFLVHNPDYGYIVYNDIPKVKALRDRFPKLVNMSSPEARVVFNGR